MIPVVNISRIFSLPGHPMQRVFLFLTLLFFLMSCSLIYIAPVEENFQAISELEKRIAEEKDPSLLAKYHLQLARLYSNYKSPQRDYRKALEEFDLYLSMVPEGTPTDEIQNWLSILRELDRSERATLEAQSAMEDQANMNQQLRENIENLLERNTSLEEVNASLKKPLKG
jgi:hypothetical protein